MRGYFKMTLLLLLVTLQNVVAQEKNSLQTKEKREIITSIKTHLLQSYIDLDLSKKMITELDKNLKSNAYDKVTSPTEFSKKLTEDLQSVSNDLHLKVQFEPKRIKPLSNILTLT